jgi:hypothetical protein
MRNVVTMHQPNYMPWIGLFSKIIQSDCFVVMNNLQYTKDGVIHRNKIRTNTGVGYLTIPIGKDFRQAPIEVVELPYDQKWKEVHWQTIYRNYKKADFFKDYSEFFENLYQKDFRYLWMMNIEIIRYLLKSFNINVEIVIGSSLNLDHNLKHTDMRIACMEKLGSKTYISGPSGRDYMEIEKMRQVGLNLKFSKFTHPVYKQRYPGFKPNISAIDLLFNMGPQCNQIIKSSGVIED